MKKFGDKIKSKIDQGEIEYSPSSWEMMEKKLSENSSQTDFEEKIQKSLSETSIPMPNGSWEHFTENTNLLNGFENSLSERLKNGEYSSNDNNWDDFSEKHNNSRLTSYEKTIKDVLNSKTVSINNSHWRTFEKLLSGNKAKKVFWRSAAILLLAISTGIGINQFSQKESGSLAKVNATAKPNSFGNNHFDSNKKRIQKLDPISNRISSHYLEDNSKQKKIETNLTHPNQNNQNNIIFSNENLTVESVKNKRLHPLPLISARTKKIPLLTLEQIKQQAPNEEKPQIKKQAHQGAILWLNFWENPALTGFYGKNSVSGFIINEWEFIDKNRDKQGEFNFVQPIVRIASYERRLNKNWSIGGFLNYELRKNWNIRKYSTSMSYTKQIFKGYHFRFGAGGTFVSQNLAVNKLTLREKAINSNYVYTTQLGNLKSKEEYSSSYHIGGFLNHKKFFLGYTVFNIFSNNFTNENNVILMKYRFEGGVHSPEYKNIKASGILRYEQELFTSFSPAIGLSYKNKLFALYEYEDLSGKKISLGYQIKNHIKAQLNYNIKSLEDYQNTDLNLDNFTERRGYLSGGINYIF